MQTLKTSEGDDSQEHIVTRHDKFIVPINIINIYGEQECRVAKDKIESNWLKILEELDEIETRSEYAVIAGDLNISY